MFGVIDMTTGPLNLVRNLRTGEKNGNCYLFIEHVVLEAAGFCPGDGIQMTIANDSLIFTKTEDKTNIVSKRKRPGWPCERPILDRCSKEITKVIRARQRIDILVSEGQLIIREERSFELCHIRENQLQGEELQKIRLLSVPAGAGIATAALVSSGYYSAVGGVDVHGEAIDVYRNNFTNGMSLWGDIRHLHPDFIPQSDVVWMSPPCDRYSPLVGFGKTGGAVEGLGMMFARMFLATGASMLLIEQVPAYYESRSFQHLKGILSNVLPYWTEVRKIDAYDMGTSIAGRARSYVVAAKFSLDQFVWPDVKVPEHRRPTVKQVIGNEWEKGNWRTIKGTVMEGLFNKQGQNNFKAEKNRTLVNLDDKKVSAIVRSYSRIQVTSSYLRHPENPELWRPFRYDELGKILGIPDWFQFLEHQAETTKTALIGQSVACDVVKALGIEAAFCYMLNEMKKKNNLSAERLEKVMNDPSTAPRERVKDALNDMESSVLSIQQEYKSEKNGQLCIF